MSLSNIFRINFSINILFACKPKLSLSKFDLKYLLVFYVDKTLKYHRIFHQMLLTLANILLVFYSLCDIAKNYLNKSSILFITYIQGTLRNNDTKHIFKSIFHFTYL